VGRAFASTAAAWPPTAAPSSSRARARDGGDLAGQLGGDAAASSEGSSTTWPRPFHAGRRPPRDRFDEEPPRLGSACSDYPSSAPCRCCRALAQEAYAAAARRVEDGGQTVLAVATPAARLLWLYSDPLTEHTRRWDGEIQECFTRLAHKLPSAGRQSGSSRRRPLRPSSRRNTRHPRARRPAPQGVSCHPL